MKKLIITTALVALSFSAHAESERANKPQGSGPNPYVECGIGAALFPDTQWAAVTSNAIWDLGTTAVISALSSPDTCNAKKRKTAMFIINTLEGLEKEVAQGGGDTTIALTQTMGCPAANQSAFNAELRSNYAEVVAKEGYASESRKERAAAMYDSVKGAATSLDKSCAVSL
jgi:hypothetical protein